MNFRMIWMGPEDDPQQGSPRPVGPFSDLRNGALPRYVQRGAGMVHQERLQSGRFKVTSLANFQARIVSDLVFDDGEQERREFGIEAKLGDTTVAFPVSAEEFGRMGWVLSKLGPQAIIYPGQHQHARVAIQSLSGPIRQERIFTHLGWRKKGSQWLYIHGGGALGSGGQIPAVQVRLPAALQAYQIGQPKDSEERVRAVHDSLRFLSVAPDRITFPLLAGVYRAAFGDAGFSFFLVGRSGTFKTSLAALCQQHFGAAMNAVRLPAGFSSTAYALQELAFFAKDALLVIDDFAPTGLGDRTLENIAEKLFRAAGNQQGRSRMNKDGRPSGAHAPRALVLATGEEVPQGQSIRARLMIIEVGPEEVERTTLTECQKFGQHGRFSAAMGAFLVWMAGQYDGLQQRLCSRAEEIRGQFNKGAVHARLPSAAATLQAGFEIFLEFAVEIGAMGNTEREELAQRSVRALNESITRHATYQQTSDPASRFMNLLRTALFCGQAHVSDRRGKAPEEPGAWGWRRKPPGRAWVPRGTRIGWIAGLDLFLDAPASYEVAQRVAGSERLTVSEQTLRHRMRELGLLTSTDSGRQMLLVRRTLEGRPRQVLHIKTSDLAALNPS
jgi:hypothetical protein